MRRDIHVQDAPPLVRQDHQDEQHAEGRRRDREEVSVGDNCSGPVTCEIVAVASSEPVDGLGDGDTAPGLGDHGSTFGQPPGRAVGNPQRARLRDRAALHRCGWKRLHKDHHGCSSARPVSRPVRRLSERVLSWRMLRLMLLVNI